MCDCPYRPHDFVRKKAETLESLNEQYAETTNAVEANETVLEELNKQTEETIQTMVETEAQKEFMRYAFLKEPKTPIGKLVAGHGGSLRNGGIYTNGMRLKKRPEKASWADCLS